MLMTKKGSALTSERWREWLTRERVSSEEMTTTDLQRVLIRVDDSFIQIVVHASSTFSSFFLAAEEASLAMAPPRRRGISNESALEAEGGGG